MLSDQEIELLTAFVDGELSQRQRKVATRLLHRSSEAREMLRQLQENAHKVKQLPRRKLEPSLVEEVLQAIAEQQAQPKPPAKPRGARRQWLPYVAASLAASLLIAALGLVYWKNMIDVDSPVKDEPFQVKNEDKKLDPTPPTPPGPNPPTPRKQNPLLDQLAKGTAEAFIKPVPVDPVFQAQFREFQNGVKSGQLVREINRDKAVQFDIKVTNNSVAMERLKSALHAQKIDILEDPSVVKALKDKDKKAQAKTEYWVYAENLTADELAKMMKDLSVADTTGMGGSRPSPYANVTVKPITTDEKQKVAGLLGIDANMLELPKNAKPPEPVMGDWKRKVVVLPVVTGAPPSDPVRQFVEQRKAGAVRVLIKIHE